MEGPIALPESIRRLILKIQIDLNPEVILLFGSRALGQQRENSDFDIAVKAGQLDMSKWRRLLAELEDEPLTLQKVDLVHYQQMDEHYQTEIDRDGVILYAKTN